jgi:hypothetical protein
MRTYVNISTHNGTDFRALASWRLLRSSEFKTHNPVLLREITHDLNTTMEFVTRTR